MYDLYRIEGRRVLDNVVMEEINSAILSCNSCDLWRRRKRPVPGTGCAKAETMFIGEAPGRQEDSAGLPFVGAAGKILEEQLCRIGLLREEVYITNIVKCRPPRNRVPLAREISTCTQLYLNRQIQTIQPKILVLLGKHSSTTILSKAGVKIKSMTQVHGKVYRIKLFNFKVTTISMFHPAAILYNPEYRELLKEDFDVLKTELKREMLLETI